MATRFRTLACPVDASTGDRRRFAEDSLTHQPLPMPLRWVRADVGAHDGAVTFGAIQGVEFDGGEYPWLTGTIFDDVDREVMPRLAEDVAEAMKLIKEGVVGISVDLDAAEVMFVRAGTNDPITEADLDDPDLEAEDLITKGRIRSGTLVAIPAFVETNHTFELMPGEDCPEDDCPEDMPMPAMVATASGDTTLPVVDDREHEWDGDAAAGRVFDLYENEDGTIEQNTADRAFLWVDGDGTQRGDYKLGFADVIDGELRIVPRAVAATAGAHGVDATDLSPEDKDAVKVRICELYAQVRKTFDDWPECPFGDSADDGPMMSTTALIASVGVDTRVPLSAFTPPVPVTGPMQIRYDFTTTPPMAYGHALTWDTCHAGFSNSCVLAPRDPDGGEFRDFHVHPVETDAGVLYAGRITAGGVHAALDLDTHAVRKHHDAMETVAYVRAVEDEFGVLVCGPIELGLGDATMEILARRKVSGDWRENAKGLPLVEILALKPGPRAISEPGFPVFGLRNGRQISLTAAMGPRDDDATKVPSYAEIFRTAYTVIREEDAKRAAAERARAELSGILDTAASEDTARLRDELIRMTEV